MGVSMPLLSSTVTVGREAERALLSESLARVAIEAAYAVLLIGDAGIGKTRLLAEIVATAIRHNALVLRGRGAEIEGLPPYLLFLEALRPFIASATGRALYRRLPAHRGHQYWADQIGRLVLEYRLEDDPPRAARAYALQNITGIDAGIACWDGKYTYWAIRPVQRDPAVKPLFSTPNHPSYPAAHGCLSTAEAAILRYLFPRDAVALDALAREAAESLVSAGIHYRSDIVAGRALGHAVAEKVIARARNDGSQ